MDEKEYYQFQGVARGVSSQADVNSVLAAESHIYDRVIGHWLSGRDSVIREVASGPGIFLVWAKRNSYSNVIGSDSAASQVSVAQSCGVQIELADAFDFLKSFEPESVDCILALDFYEHLDKASCLQFFQLAHSRLGPCGRLILRGPNGDSPLVGRALFNDITHEFCLTSTAMRANLSMAGFGNVEIVDPTIASVRTLRAVKIPLVIAARWLVRTIYHLATRERIELLSASTFVMAERKPRD